MEEEIRSVVPQIHERKRQLAVSEAEERRLNNLICDKANDSGKLLLDIRLVGHKL